MKILKRDFREEEFDIGKIKTSIVNTGCDCRYLLLPGERKVIINKIQKKIEELQAHTNDRIISSRELKMIIFESLKELDYNLIANYYIAI